MLIFSYIWKNEWSPEIIIGIISPIIALGVSAYFGISNPRLVKKERIEGTFENLKQQAVNLKFQEKDLRRDLCNQFILLVITNAKKYKSKKLIKRDLCSYRDDVTKKHKHKTSLYETILKLTNAEISKTETEKEKAKRSIIFLILNTNIKKIKGLNFKIIFETLCEKDLKIIDKKFKKS